jgi:hypothetical protein
MTIRSGHHVVGSPRAGRGGGKIGHASIRWLLFHMAKAIPHFSEACFNAGVRNGPAASTAGPMFYVLAADAQVASSRSPMTRPHHVYRDSRV